MNAACTPCAFSLIVSVARGSSRSPLFVSQMPAAWLIGPAAKIQRPLKRFRAEGEELLGLSSSMDSGDEGQ